MMSPYILEYSCEDGLLAVPDPNEIIYGRMPYACELDGYKVPNMLDTYINLVNLP